MRTDTYPQVSEQSTNEATWRQRLSGPILSWIGIIGGAITLFSNLEGVLKLADWARFVVVHWHEWTNAFWSWVFGWIEIEISALVVSYLTFTVFFLMVGMSTRQRATTSLSDFQSRRVPSFLTPDWGLLACYFILLVIMVYVPLFYSRTYYETRIMEFAITAFACGTVSTIAAALTLAIAPSRLIARRMWMVLVIVALLMVGNELSKLDLIPHLTPPDL